MFEKVAIANYKSGNKKKQRKSSKQINPYLKKIVLKSNIEAANNL